MFVSVSRELSGEEAKQQKYCSVIASCVSRPMWENPGYFHPPVPSKKLPHLAVRFEINLHFAEAVLVKSTLFYMFSLVSGAMVRLPSVEEVSSENDPERWPTFRLEIRNFSHAPCFYLVSIMLA